MTDHDDDFEIDPELWVEYLVMQLSDDQSKEALVQKLAQKTGLIPESVEKIIHATLEYLLRKSRSN